MSIPPQPAIEQAPAAVRLRPPVRVWDLVLTIALLVLFLGLAALLVIFAPFLAFASDPCGGSIQCNSTQLSVGILIAFVGPIVVAFLTIAAAIVLLVFRRLAFWAPIVGMVLAVAVWVFGAALVIQSVPGSSF